MIITTQRHPFNRWLDRLLTLAGWFAFSYLLAQGLLLLLRHSMNVAGFEQIDPIFPTLTTFLLYGVLLGLNGLLLLAWSRWHRRTLKKAHVQGNLYSQRLYGSPVHLDSPLRFANQDIDIVRQNQVVVLYHSQDGAVEYVKPTTSTMSSLATTEDNSKLAEVIALNTRISPNRPTPNALAIAQSV